MDGFQYTDTQRKLFLVALEVILHNRGIEAAAQFTKSVYMDPSLATTMLQSHRSFHRVSYRFAIASLVVLVVSVMLVFLVWFALFWCYLIFTWRNDRAVEDVHVPAWPSHKRSHIVDVLKETGL